jgi:hypothetical protein
MQVGSASAFNIPRNTYSTDNLSASAVSTGARLKILQVRQLMDKAMRQLRARTGQQASGAGAYRLEAKAGATAIPTSITI